MKTFVRKILVLGCALAVMAPQNIFASKQGAEAALKVLGQAMNDQQKQEYASIFGQVLKDDKVPKQDKSREAYKRVFQKLDGWNAKFWPTMCTYMCDHEVGELEKVMTDQQKAQLNKAKADIERNWKPGQNKNFMKMEAGSKMLDIEQRVKLFYNQNK